MRDLMLQFIASLTLCDHMGDVSNDVWYVMKKLDLPKSVLDADNFDELRKELHKLGVTTLYGTQIGDE